MILADANVLWLIAGCLAVVVALVGFGIRSSVNRSSSDVRRQNLELQNELKRLKAAQSHPLDQEAALRKRALVEALRREPELGDAPDPESRRQLQALVDAVTEELRLSDEVAQLKAERDAAAQREALAAVTEQRIQQAREQEAAELRLTEADLVGLPEGFYVDPLNEHRSRYWDGERWDTETYPRERRTPNALPPSP